MEITAKQLRIESGRILSQAADGQEITVTYRGKPYVKIVPVTNKKNLVLEEPDSELFGIWKKRKDTEKVEQYVRNIRKGRNCDN
jgi:prevent-host-death family protein